MNHLTSQADPPRRTHQPRRPLRRTVVLALAAAVAVGGAAACDRSSSSGASPTQNADAKDVSLTITSNSIAGGKNADEADWYEKYVIPTFTKQQAAKGVTVKVTFQPSGVDDEQYKTKVALDLKSKAGADIMALDGIWVGEFAQAGYIKPLTDVAGPGVTSWEGWSQIPKAVQANVSFDGKTYGIPAGTDGRVLYFNKKLFAQAGLPADWQPKSWQDIIDAGAKLKSISGVDPVQINAGTAMGEATSMQGVLPLLVGAGAEIYSDGKWQGNTKAIRDVLTFYKQLLDQGLEDKNFQQAAKGRDQSFAAFAAGKVGILLEGDYFWRSVINPQNGDAPMATRDSDVGWAFIPAQQPGSGVGGSDHVSMSGGGGYFLNPNTKYPQQAWELLQFLGSADAINALLNGSAKITARQDVNAQVLSKDPFLSFVSEKVLPVTHYRPGLAIYPQISQALQQATADIVSGKSVDEAAKAYAAAVEKAAGGADKVSSS
jgi:multiple sugar transport system substrate-binding protein